MLDGMTNIKASEVLKEIKYYTEDLPPYSPDEVAEALEMAIKALEPKPMEKFDDVKTHIQRLAGDYKCWDNRLTWEEALELNRMLEAQPNSNEFFNFDAPMVKKSDAVSREGVIETINTMRERCDTNDINDYHDLLVECFKVLPSAREEDAVNREKVIEEIEFYQNNPQHFTYESLIDDIKNLPPVIPQRKVGKWTRVPIRNEKGGCIGAKMICSECDNDNKHDEYMKFCPNCGAEMGCANDVREQE